MDEGQRADIKTTAQISHEWLKRNGLYLVWTHIVKDITKRLAIGVCPRLPYGGLRQCDRTLRSQKLPHLWGEALPTPEQLQSQL